jgi:hypothetical protein
MLQHIMFKDGLELLGQIAVGVIDRVALVGPGLPEVASLRICRY